MTLSEHSEFPFPHLPLSPNFLPSFMGALLVCLSGTRPIKLSFNARISISFRSVSLSFHPTSTCKPHPHLRNRPQNTNSPHHGPETLSYPLHQVPNISRIPISRTPNGNSIQPTHLLLLSATTPGPSSSTSSSFRSRTTLTTTQRSRPSLTADEFHREWKVNRRRRDDLGQDLVGPRRAGGRETKMAKRELTKLGRKYRM